MRIGTGLPNQVRNVRPAVLPAWARQAENAGFTSLATVGRYAYPGVSDFYAVTKGKPSGQVEDFIYWSQTNKAAKKIIESNWIPLPKLEPVIPG